MDWKEEEEKLSRDWSRGRERWIYPSLFQGRFLYPASRRESHRLSPNIQLFPSSRWIVCWSKESKEGMVWVARGKTCQRLYDDPNNAGYSCKEDRSPPPQPISKKGAGQSSQGCTDFVERNSCSWNPNISRWSIQLRKLTYLEWWNCVTSGNHSSVGSRCLFEGRLWWTNSWSIIHLLQLGHILEVWMPVRRPLREVLWGTCPEDLWWTVPCRNVDRNRYEEVGVFLHNWKGR